jgi:2'-hydroxyisoflavone reductase
MRILVLGGTQFVGRHLVEAALQRGHAVTLFNRGRTHAELFPEVERLQGDRDGDLTALAGLSFDAVVDTSGYVPRVVSRTLDALGEVGHYTFVSTVSVYADLSRPPQEDDALATLDEPTEEFGGAAYGALKALCEEAVRARFPDAFVPRPGLIVGPWDPTGRFTYWPERLAAGGRVLAPAPPERPSQTIDARDLASWIVLAAEQGLAGAFNALGGQTTLGAVLETCRTAAEADSELVWVAPDFLARHEVGEWLELPLWIEDPARQALFTVPVERARAAGLRTRPLADTVADILAWLRSGNAPADPPGGLDRDKERRLLEAWAAR